MKKTLLATSLAMVLSVGATNRTVKSFIPEKFSYCDEARSVSIGIDISRYQTVRYEEIDSTITFIICKATEGTRLIDRKFSQHWTNIGNHITKGAYHYFRPYASGKEQAELFLNTVNFSSGHLLPVLDVEGGRGYGKLNPKIYIANLKAMIRTIEDKLGVKPIIYTNAHFWNHNFASHFKDMSKEYHLWIADYRDREEPGIPNGWEDWSIWQHSCRGRLSGVHADVDLNICKVDLSRLIIP